MGSKNHPKTGFQTNIEKMMIFNTPTPLWIELWLQRELDSHFYEVFPLATILDHFLDLNWPQMATQFLRGVLLGDLLGPS